MALPKVDSLERKKTDTRSLAEKVRDLDEVRIYNQYLHEHVSDSGGTYLSPFRKERSPSFSIFRSNRSGKLVWKDHALGTTGDVLDLIMQLEGIDTVEAIRLAEGDHLGGRSHNTGSRSHKKTKKRDLIIPKPEPWSGDAVEFWDNFGVTLPTLQEYNVVPIKKYHYKGAWLPCAGRSFAFVFPQRGGDVDYYTKIYQPENPDKRYKWMSCCPPFVYQGYDQLEYNTDLIIITKSLKDVMVLRELGYDSVAPQAETANLYPQFVNHLRKKYDYIIVMYDNDDTGRENAKNTVDVFKGLLRMELPKHMAKDISDFAKEYGMYEAQDIIEELVNRTIYNGNFQS